MLDLEKSVTESLVILEFPFHHSHLLQSNQFLLCTSVPVILGERFSGRQGFSCIFPLNEELFRTPESSKSQGRNTPQLPGNVIQNPRPGGGGQEDSLPDLVPDGHLK